MRDCTREFIDVISQINNLGKERGFKNGLSMARAGLRKGILTQSEFNDYQNLHNLRNGGGHGFMGDLCVRERTLVFAQRVFYKLKRSNLHSSDNDRGGPCHERGQTNERRGQRGERDFHYVLDYYRSRGYETALSHAKPQTLGDGGIGERTARLDDNKLEVTVESCKKTVLGYSITLSIIDVRSEPIEIEIRNGYDTMYSDIIEVSANRKKLVGAVFKHWPLKEIEIALNGHCTRYSIAREKMM